MVAMRGMQKLLGVIRILIIPETKVLVWLWPLETRDGDREKKNVAEEIH